MIALFISNDPTLFSAQSSTRTRMRAYASAIGTLHILSTAPKGTPLLITEEVPNGTLVLHAIVSKKPFSLLKMRAQAHELILKEGIQIVSAQDPFEYGWVALKAIEGTAAKLHIQIHTDFLSPWFTRSKIMRSAQGRVSPFNKTRLRIAKRVLPHAQGIRVVSKRIAESLMGTYGTKIPTPTIIPLTVPSVVPPPAPLPPHAFTFTLITIGRLEPEKRIEDIFVALSHITASYPSVGLILIGDGRERARLEKLVFSLGLSAKILFLGSRDDAWGLLQSGQAYIQASAYEGYGRTLIEAALARVPIITTDVGIIGEVFRGYEEVLAAPVGDPAALATHIRGLLEDNEARQQFIMKAEKVAQEHLASVHTGPDAIASDLQAVLTHST